MYNKNKNYEIYIKAGKEKDHYGLFKYWWGWAGAFHRRRIDLLREFFREFENKDISILDLGSGECYLPEVFSDNYKNITALDISYSLIKKGKTKYPWIIYIMADAEDPPLKKKFDVIHAGEIIEHLKKPERAIKRWCQLLKTDGYLIISTPNGCFSLPNKEHISLMSYNKLKKMLKMHNLKIINSYGIGLGIVGLPLILNTFSLFIPSVTKKISNFLIKITNRHPIFSKNIFLICKKC